MLVLYEDRVAKPRIANVFHIEVTPLWIVYGVHYTGLVGGWLLQVDVVDVPKRAEYCFYVAAELPIQFAGDH